MPRANRYFIPCHVWHITHRCHKQEFLLKFKRDRERWLYWLWEAKKRFGLTILNYIVTSNHIHLLVQDGYKQEVAKSMQLIAGRTAQEFNRRKNRKGAFWEDRYHATAVESGENLIKCLVYIYLNMVRAGVVQSPSEWLQSGFNEIQSPPEKYQLIDRKKLCQLDDVKSDDELKKNHFAWVKEGLIKSQIVRDEKWTGSLAVGGKLFAEKYIEAVGIKAKYREVKVIDNCHLVKEPSRPYKIDL